MTLKVSIETICSTPSDPNTLVHRLNIVSVKANREIMTGPIDTSSKKRRNGWCKTDTRALFVFNRPSALAPFSPHRETLTYHLFCKHHYPMRALIDEGARPLRYAHVSPPQAIAVQFPTHYLHLSAITYVAISRQLPGIFKACRDFSGFMGILFNRERI